MERDTSSDRGGDQAVWRDLVARLELPQAIDPADAPWPDRENLTSARHAGRQDTSRQDTSRQDTGRSGTGRPAAGHRRAGRHDPDGLGQDGLGQDGLGQDGPAQDGQEQSRADADESAPGQGYDVPVSRRRVIRPATFLRFAEAGQFGEGDPGRPGPPAGRHAVPPARLPREDPSRPRPDRGGLGGGLDFQDLADLEFFDEDEDGRYVPPQIPPQPKLDPVARGAWTALFGGPGYLFLAITLSWQVPGWAELAAIIAFITGFVVLVSRLGDGPSRKDGPDQGAVV